jgi:hypothetical protein
MRAVAYDTIDDLLPESGTHGESSELGHTIK